MVTLADDSAGAPVRLPVCLSRTITHDQSSNHRIGIKSRRKPKKRDFNTYCELALSGVLMG